jgi:hypothetical protein
VAVVQVDGFWIAQTLIAALVVAQIADGVTELMQYRRGRRGSGAGVPPAGRGSAGDGGGEQGGGRQGEQPVGVPVGGGVPVERGPDAFDGRRALTAQHRAV